MTTAPNLAYSHATAERSVRIRSPNITVPDDFEVRLPSHTTIATLKEQLAAHSDIRYDNPAGMRLIYQGRILEDEETLATTLKHSEEQQQTFHLVAKRSSLLTATAPSNHCEAARPPASTDRAANAASSASIATSDTATVVSRPNTAYSPAVSDSAAGSAVPQLASITQYYSYYRVKMDGRAYLLQVANQQVWQAPKVSLSTLLAQLTATSSTTAATTMLPVRSMSPIQAPIPEQQPPPPPMAAEAAAAPPIDEETLQRMRQRYLADLWLLLKLSFFAYLFTQRAGLWQTCLVYLTGTVIFLHQSGRLTLLRAYWQQTRARFFGPPAVAVVERDGTPAAENNSSETDDEQQPASEQTPLLAATLAADAEPAPAVSAWRHIEHALTTFFTSLIPTQPNQLDPGLNAADAAGQEMAVM